MHNLTAVFHSYPQISPQVFDISSCKRKKLPTGSRLSSHSLLSMASKHGGLLTRAALRNFPRVKKRGEVQPPVSYTHLDVYKRQMLHKPKTVPTTAACETPNMQAATRIGIYAVVMDIGGR